MIEAVLGFAVVAVVVIFAALFLAVLGAWSISAGGLLVDALIGLLPSRHTREPSA